MTKIGATDVPARVGAAARVYLESSQIFPDNLTWAIAVGCDRQECRNAAPGATSAKDPGCKSSSASSWPGRCLMQSSATPRKPKDEFQTSSPCKSWRRCRSPEHHTF